MKNFILLIVLLCVIPIFRSQNNDADTSNLALKPWVEIITVRHIKHVGKIISDDGREVLIDTKNIGKVYIKKSEIASMREIGAKKDNSSKGDDGEIIANHRYFMSTSSLPLKRGQNMVGIHLLGYDFTIPVSNSFSIGIFASWLASPFGLILKNNFKTANPNLNFSLGLMGGSSSYINSFEGYGGLLFGNATYGNSKFNVSLSAGYSLLYSGMFKKYDVQLINTTNSYNYNNMTNIEYANPQRSSFTFNLSGKAQISNKVTFLLETILNVENLTVPADIQYYTGSELIYGSPSSNIFDVFNLFDIFGYNSSTTLQVTNTKTITKYNLLLFPAVRFQFQENKAFQLTLGSMHSFTPNDRKSYPFPMCSWFVTF